MMSYYQIVQDKEQAALPGIALVQADALDSLAAASFGGFVVRFDPADPDAAVELLHRVRGHESPRIYLRPVVLLRAAAHLAVDAEVSGQFDDLLTVPSSEAGQQQPADRLAKINQWIDALPNVDEHSADSNMAFKALRLIASRDLKLKPSMTDGLKSGFTYPLLSSLFGDDSASLLNVLEFLQKEQMLGAEFSYKAHFCPFCDSAFLNFMENCPDCKSANLERDELLHHFKCGHVASLSDFTVNHQLVCPKCDERLRHIGVDYDKPSIVYRCLDCSLSFQDPAINAQCYSCHKTSEIDDVAQKNVSHYSLTAIGNNAAVFGLDTLFTSILQSELSLHSLSEFKSFFTVEKSRIQRYKRSTSSLATIHFHGLNQVYSRLGRKTQQLFRELSAVFKAIFRVSDVITAQNESVFLVLMTETDVDSARLGLKRLTDALQELLTNLLGDAATVELQTEVINVLDCEEIEEFVERVLGQQE